MARGYREEAEGAKGARKRSDPIQGDEAHRTSLTCLIVDKLVQADECIQGVAAYHCIGGLQHHDPAQQLPQDGDGEVSIADRAIGAPSTVVPVLDGEGKAAEG